jgi:hypothetical protein
MTWNQIVSDYSTVVVALVLVFIALYITTRVIVKAIDHVGARYELLYRQLHAEIMNTLNDENRRIMAEVSALLEEHNTLADVLDRIRMHPREVTED